MEGLFMYTSAKWLCAPASVLLMVFISCHRPTQTGAGLSLGQRYSGDGWLSWSPVERITYVDTYIDAYNHAYNEACRNADDLFVEKLPYEKGDENHTDIPVSRCLDRKAKYSRIQRGDDGEGTSPYPEIITEMYEKHPDARSAPYFLLMTLLSDGQAQTSEDLYKSQLGKWPNARYDSH